MTFDIIVYALVAVAAVMGYMAGLLRSLATILGYLVAAPFALGVAPALSYYLATNHDLPPLYNGVVLAALMLFGGIVMGALFRRAISDLTGKDVGIADRLLGAFLGAVRIALVGVVVVLIFDLVFVPGRAPAFLKGSVLRPYFTAAGQAGLRTLPPDVTAYLDRIRAVRKL